MPVPNESTTPWKGFLVSGLQNAEVVFIRHFKGCLAAKHLPKVQWKVDTVNMWREQKRAVDVTSTLDGTSLCTVHVTPYGNDLFIGVAFAVDTSNCYKAMAATCFARKVVDSIIEAIALTGKELNVEVTWEEVGK